MIYIKCDGSLDDGMEIVTHPMSLDYHLEKFCWDALTARAIKLGYRSHQTSTCGLHVHVSRDGLGETYEEQEATISRILYFTEAHWNELLKFSRRTEYTMNRWAARHGYEHDPNRIQRLKNYILETTLSNFGPDLLNRIHFRCIWRNIENDNVFRHNHAL